MMALAGISMFILLIVCIASICEYSYILDVDDDDDFDLYRPVRYEDDEDYDDH